MNKFYIGQKIVAIKDHSQGIFKKGDEFTVLDVRDSLCKCNNYDVHIGIFDYVTLFEECSNSCFKKFRNDCFWWFCPTMFAPIELSTTTFEDVIKQYEPCLN